MPDTAPAWTREEALEWVAELALWFHDDLHAGVKAVDSRRPPCNCRLALALQALDRLAEPEEAATLDSPNFEPESLKDLAARSYRRQNRRPR